MKISSRIPLILSLALIILALAYGFVSRGALTPTPNPTPTQVPTESPIPTSTPLIEQLVTLRGMVKPYKRTAPDIAYDYQLVLDEPYNDPLNASGNPLTRAFVVQGIPPVEPKIGLEKHVLVTGYIRWGYAEARVLHIQTMSLLDAKK